MDKYDELTNEAKMLLLKLYREYTLRRYAGENRLTARTFNLTPDQISKKLMPNESGADVLEYARELDRKGFLDIMYGNNSFGRCELCTDGISKMQDRFKNGVKAAINLLAEAF